VHLGNLNGGGNDERMTKPRTRSPLCVIASLIRHSSFGFSHSLACATLVHGPNVRPKLKFARYDSSRLYFADD